MRWLVCVAGLLISLGAVAQGPKPSPIQGVWVVKEARRDGKDANELAGHRVILAKERFVITSKDGKPVYAGSYRTDAGKVPPTIDFVHTLGTYKGKTWKGIYELTGDTMRICDNAPNLEGPRPMDFKAAAGSGTVCVLCVRKEP